MIEWCYQWDDPKFVENHYKYANENDIRIREKTVDALAENLWKDLFSWLDSDKKHVRNDDAKDAKYFMNL